MNINTLLKKLASTIARQTPSDPSIEGSMETKPLVAEDNTAINNMRIMPNIKQPNPYMNQTMRNYQVTMGGGINKKPLAQKKPSIKTPLVPNKNIDTILNKSKTSFNDKVASEKPDISNNIELLKKLFRHK